MMRQLTHLRFKMIKFKDKTRLLSRKLIDVLHIAGQILRIENCLDQGKVTIERKSCSPFHLYRLLKKLVFTSQCFIKPWLPPVVAFSYMV